VGDVAIRVIVELQAKAGRRDELRDVIERIVATHGPSMPGYRGSEVYEAVGDPDVLVEIADWESAEAREALMEDTSVMDAMAPMFELLAAPFRATVVTRRG
jgi:quinol monooxygenase YgiN